MVDDLNRVDLGERRETADSVKVRAVTRTVPPRMCIPASMSRALRRGPEWSVFGVQARAAYLQWFGFGPKIGRQASRCSAPWQESVATLQATASKSTVAPARLQPRPTDARAGRCLHRLETHVFPMADHVQANGNFAVGILGDVRRSRKTAGSSNCHIRREGESLGVVPRGIPEFPADSRSGLEGRERHLRAMVFHRTG